MINFINYEPVCAPELIVERRQTATDMAKVLKGLYMASMARAEGMIKKVIFNDPATIVFWGDGDKTIVKCKEGEEYDKKTGFELCYLKKKLSKATYRKYSDYFFFEGRKGERFVDLICKMEMGGYEPYKKALKEWVK